MRQGPPAQGFVHYLCSVSLGDLFTGAVSGPAVALHTHRLSSALISIQNKMPYSPSPILCLGVFSLEFKIIHKSRNRNAYLTGRKVFLQIFAPEHLESIIQI